MTVTYTNEVKTNILNPLQLLIFTEFKPTPVVMNKVFDPSFMTRGKYIRYWFLGSEKVLGHSNGETRDYNIEVVFYFDVARHEFKRTFDDDLSPESERLKRLLENNEAYTSSSTYRWHQMSVEIDEPQTVEELEDIEDEETIAQRFNITITRSNFR
jgi:hypothetical protein